MALLAVAAIALRPSLGGAWGRSALLGVTAFAAWQGISSAWAWEPSAAIRAMNQTLLYATAFALVVVGVRRVADLVGVTRAVLAVCVVVVGHGLVQRLMPDLVGGDIPGRLASPLTYWNALGALAALGLLLALAGAGDPRDAPWLRAVGAALVPVFALALLLTFSRGAVVALLAGIVVLVAFAPGRVETVLATVATLVVSVPLLAVANGEETIASLNRRVLPDPDAGTTVLVALLVTMAGAAVLGLAIAIGTARLTPTRRRRTGRVITSAVVVAALVGAVVAMPAGGPVSWADRQFTSFKDFDTADRTSAASIADRLAVSAGSGRWQNWDVAAGEFRSSPVVGTGAGDYRFWWNAGRPMDQSVQNAHSLYLEALAESGVIGLLLIAGAMLAVVAGVALALRRGVPDGVARPLVVALAGGTLVGVHMAGDWVWQMPAVTILAVALGAAAVKTAHTAGRDGTARAEAPATRAVLVVAAVAAIAMVAGPLASSSSLGTARGLAADGDLPAALRHARTAADLDPQSPTPRLLQANLLADLGRPAEADRAFAAAVARSPHDWAVYADWSAALIRRGDVRGARATARRAAALNPREPRPRYLLEGAGA